jgi:hypothetical protein
LGLGRFTADFGNASGHMGAFDVLFQCDC